MPDQIQEQDLSKKIKLGLENWREIILHVYDLLIWKNFPLYPGFIFGFSTFVFIFIVLLDPTLLSFVSSVGLVIVLSDYLAPIVMSKVFNPDSWTGQKEKKFEEISSKIASAISLIKSDVCYFYQLKESRPKMYYAVVILGLLFLSWLGNNVNNIFLTYVIVTFLLLLPGLKHNGYLKKASSLANVYLCQVFQSFGSKKEKKK